MQFPRLPVFVVVLVAVCLSNLSAQVAPPPTTFDIKAFGAVGDGKALDHAAINRAIEAANHAGGGTVRVPAGTYRCFSIHLQSHVTIQFEPGAIILAADPLVDPGLYDAAEPNAADPYEDFGHSHWHNSLFWGENLENVAIVGPGLIHGAGLHRGFGNPGNTASPTKFAVEPAPRPAVVVSCRGHAAEVRLSHREGHSFRRDRQQGHRAEELPGRHPAGFLDPARRALRYPGDRCRSPPH